MPDIKLLTGQDIDFIKQLEHTLEKRAGDFKQKLMTTTDLSLDLPEHNAWRMVIAFDNAKHRTEFRILGCIVNAALTHKSEIFLFSSKTIWNDLIKQDKNNLPCVNGKQVSAARKMALGLLPNDFPYKLFEELAPPSKYAMGGQSRAGIYRVTHEVLLDYIKG